MSIKLYYNSFLPSSPSKSWIPNKPPRSYLFVRHATSTKYVYNFQWCQSRQFSKYCTTFHNSIMTGQFFCPASNDDGVTLNVSPQDSISVGVQEKRVKLNQSLQGENSSDGLVHSLHDAARVFELAIREQKALLKTSWFSTALFGIDTNAWVKTLSYEASVYSLLQAAIKISSQGDGREQDLNIFIQRSLLHLSSPLEILIREKLSSKQPEAYEWFASEHVLAVVTTFVNSFENDLCFTGGSVGKKQNPFSSGNASDVSLLMLALICTAAITKLGSTKISCSMFFSMVTDIIGRFMDKLVDFIHIRQAYVCIKDIGLQREFLLHFGSRAAACRVKNDQTADEVVFWVELLQEQLQRAIDREKIWSRLTTCESIEVLERDLAIIGFFIALGRNSKSLLSLNGFDDIDDPIEGFLRYLIGGIVLYYPQLSLVSSYQMYVEVVCEELDWIPFYQGNVSALKQSNSLKNRKEVPPNLHAIPQVLNVCSHWMQSFVKYSKWLEDPSNVKAARFISRGHVKLMDCLKEQRMLSKSENDAKGFTVKAPSGTFNLTESVCLEKALVSVEEALRKLEGLLQELHVSSSNSGKEHLKAACSDLEMIRKLKKEAEFLEASFRAKATFLQKGDDASPQSPLSEQVRLWNGKTKMKASNLFDKGIRVTTIPGLWNFLARFSRRKSDHGSSVEGGPLETANMGVDDSEINGIHRIENLRKELTEIEERVKKCAVQTEFKEDIVATNDAGVNWDKPSGLQLIHVQNMDNVGKSLNKLKGLSMDVLQGTQLLSIDVVSAMGLLRRGLTGDDLTAKEKQVLRRTLSDLASVVPISVLMLLPVTAVGHAAMLAAIQRYVPSLIPSAYGRERLDLLRQVEKVMEVEIREVNPDEDVEKLG